MNATPNTRTPELLTATESLIAAIEQAASWTAQNSPAIKAALEAAREAVNAKASTPAPVTVEAPAPVIIDAVASDPEPTPEPEPTPAAWEIEKPKVYGMNGKGGLVEIVSNFDNLQPGAVIWWGGNAAFPETNYCILSRKDSNWGVSYQCYNLDDENKNATLHHVEARSIKSPDDESLWHGQHFYHELGETKTPEEVETFKANHLKQAHNQENREAEIKAEHDRLEALGRELWPALIGECPAVIVAEREESDVDTQADYFGSHTTARVILAASKHTRNLFSEFRKAAEKIEETQHLGLGKGRFTPYVAIAKSFNSNGSCYYEGSRSHWHRELDKNENGNAVEFLTREEAESYIEEKGTPCEISFDGEVIPFTWKIREDEIENRENYTGGHGYYLGYSRYSGWQVSKDSFWQGEPRRQDYIDLARRHDHLKK